MKKFEIYEGFVERVNFPNRGIVRVENENDKVKVKNCLPGQKIRFMLTKNRTGTKEGQLKEVISPAPIEQGDVFCPYFDRCGGCAYQTMTYEGQCEYKASQVVDLLTAVDPEIPFEGIKESPMRTKYRNKMEFSFGDEEKGGPLTLGMHKKGSFYDIVSVPECKIVDEDFNLILSTVLDYCTEQKFSFFHKMSHEGFLRHLLVRKGSHRGEILVCLVTTSQQSHDFTELVNRLCQQTYSEKIVGILHMINDSLADVVQADDIKTLYGQDYFYDELLSLKFKVSPFSFFQTNSWGAEELYKTAREFIGDVNGQVVYDLYSGTGTIAQVLAPVAKKVIGVEIIEEAVVAARENASENGLDNCEFIAGDVLKVLDEIEDKPDFIVLDPPRDGVHPKALDHILSYGVEQILYISCKPTSLQRDLAKIQTYGYRVKRCVCVDMFPWTRGVETVALLSK